MQIDRRPADDLLDVVRVLLLAQGAILVATTIEATVWGVAFSGAPGVPMLMSGAAAAIVLIARLRISADRPTSRRLVYAVECVVLVTFVFETALAIALAGALPPVAAVLTQLALPLSVVALLRRASRSARRAMRPHGAGALEGMQ